MQKEFCMRILRLLGGQSLWGKLTPGPADLTSGQYFMKLPMQTEA